MFPSLLESVDPIFYSHILWAGTDSWLECGPVQAGRTIDSVHCLSQKKNDVHSNGKRV